ncbi:hypothetical protein ACA910_002866 [Epithemia clementina (nom. ined.)]
MSSAAVGSSGSSGVVSYEAYAPRSAAQIARLNRIEELTAGPTARASTAGSSGNDAGHSLFFSQAMSVPSLYHDDEFDWKSQSRQSKAEEGKEENKEDTAASLDKKVHTSPVVQEAVSRAMELSQALTHQWKHTTSLRLACRASLNIAQDISAAHVALIRHSGELSAAADRLHEQATALENHAAEIGQPLQHYNAVDRIGIQVGVLFKNTNNPQQKQSHVRGLAKIKVDDDEFPKILQEIDEAILYFGKESGGSQALQELQKNQSSRKQQQQQPLSGNLEYYRRALVLQEAALFLIQEAVADRIQTTAQQITNALPSTQVVPADQLEASLIYTRFHGISNRSNRLITLVKDRLHNLQGQRYAQGGEEALTAYYDLIQKCRTTYCSCRENLLRPTLRAHMEQLHKLHGPTGMTRLASVFWIRLCTVETNLYVDFFGDTQPHKASELQACLASLCTATLHRTVRRSLVTLTDLDTLCQIVTVLREEGNQASQQPTTALAAAKALMHLTEDAQERLIFCANRQLQKEVIRFKATPKDLDYPNKLLQLRQKQQHQLSAGQMEVGASDSLEDAQEQLNWVYESWFLPMRTVLRILSKIFRVVEARVFEDLALNSIQACTAALKDGAQFIRTAKSQRDAHLFLVQHLLILREQVSPFDLELRTVERQLDFSEAGKAMAKFLANRNRRLLSMNTENAIVMLLREGVSVQESSVDSKRDLEDALRTACNDFIAHALQSLAGRLVNFVQERSNNTSTGPSGDGGTGTPNKSQQKIKESPQLVTEILQETVETIKAQLPTLWEQMSLYLDNPSTQSILLKPVTKKIMKAVSELKQWMNNTVDHQWNSDSRSQALAVANQVEPALKLGQQQQAQEKPQMLPPQASNVAAGAVKESTPTTSTLE